MDSLELVRVMIRDVTRQTHQTHASGVYGESSVIWVRDSDSARDRVKVRVTSVFLVTAGVRFRDVAGHRHTRCRQTHQTHFTHIQEDRYMDHFGTLPLLSTKLLLSGEKGCLSGK